MYFPGFNTDSPTSIKPAKCINISNVFTALDQVKGVQTVKSVKINNKAGGNYSAYAYDTEGATKDGILYPSYDPCIFEVKFPDIDISGRVTTI